MNKKRIILRILALIPFMCIMAIYHVYWFVVGTLNYLRYGAEMITHTKEDPATIGKIYLELKKQQEQKES